MTCRGWQQLLQQHLDNGAGCAIPLRSPPDAEQNTSSRNSLAALEQHLQVCPHCAAMQPALHRFLDGLTLLAPPHPPADLASRIIATLSPELTHRRRQRQRRRLVPMLAVAVAAAVLVAVGLRGWWSVPGTPNPGRPDLPIVKKPEPPAPHPRAPLLGQRAPFDRPEDGLTPLPLRDSVTAAGSAVARLTTRTATTTIDQTSSLLPLLPAPTVEPFAATADLQTPIEPIREASAGVSAGLAPVADSARRAVGLFFRDLPMGRPDRPAADKPG